MAFRFADPRSVSFEDCAFYHVIDMPGVGTVGGQWDLRGRVDEYLGNVNLAGKRVLEIGPASGFLTVEMERRGADVVGVEVTDEPGWDFVPYPAQVLDPVMAPRRDIMRKVKNSFWFTHAAHHSRAKLYYGDVYNLPAEIGFFDTAVMTAVLLHTRCPLSIVEQCAKRSSAVIITDRFFSDIEGQPVCRLNATVENQAWDAWWQFSTRLFSQFLAVMGFGRQTVTTHSQLMQGVPIMLFTIVASR